MSKPLIGVVPLIDYERESLWMVPGYMDGISEAGGLPVMLPLTDDAADLKELASFCRGFLFTGGQDVSPSLYGQPQLKECGEISPERDRMETVLLRLAEEADKPVLGICRGIQFINAAMGGSLYQDLPTQHISDTDHHQKPPYDIPAHKDRIIKGTPLYELLEDILTEDGLLPVNSYHHSAVLTPAAGLKVCAVSEDGIVEGVYNDTKKFFLAIQWHPEFCHSTDEASKRIFKAFVASCGA